MSVDSIVPIQKTTAPIQASPRPRFSVPRGMLAGIAAVLALTWGLYAFAPGGSLLSAELQTGLYLGLLVLTICSRRAKVLVARTFQRYTLNPLFRTLLAIGVNPLGLAILETTGRVTGRPHRIPVGNGRKGEDFWIIAEHGYLAGYVRNIQHNPCVRVRLRTGLRYHWVTGTATIRPDEDPLARQRKVIAWHPLRAYNAINVRTFGADLLTVHVKLDVARAEAPSRPAPVALATIQS